MATQAAWHLRFCERLRVPKDELEQGVHGFHTSSIHARSLQACVFPLPPTQGVEGRADQTCLCLCGVPMSYPKSALTPPEPKLKTQGQMMALLKERSKARAQLHWNPPVRNADGSGHQTAAGTDYEVRKTLTEGRVMYWAWYAKKLLGYNTDVEIARNFCEAHALGGTSCAT